MNITKIRSVCIIDDDPIFIYGTKRIMNEADFTDEILVFNDGQEAFDALKAITEKGDELPSMIFLDINMPIMTGWEFLDEFIKMPNNNSENIIIYIISSSVDPRDIARIQQYKIVNNYILKPISIEDLHNILKSVGN